MMTWTIEETVETTATAEQMWAMWSRPETWPTWDHGTEWVKTEGPFVAGAKGVMKPVGGPQVKFEMIETSPLHGFKDRTYLPLTTLDFTHWYTPAVKGGAKATITHRVEMRGWLTPLFRRVIGTNIRKGLPEAMKKLATLAEKVD